MSATNIIDTAPLGALIRYTDSSPRPPARLTWKLAAWERSNGVGRLCEEGSAARLFDLDGSGVVHAARGQLRL